MHIVVLTVFVGSGTFRLCICLYCFHQGLHFWLGVGYIKYYLLILFKSKLLELFSSSNNYQIKSASLVLCFVYHIVHRMIAQKLLPKTQNRAADRF